MLRLALLPAVLLSLLLAGAALAQDDDEEEEEERFLDTNPEFNKLGSGVNALVTWQLDPMALAADGNEIFEGWVTPFQYTFGFLAGLGQGTYRLAMGALDVATFPFARIFPIVGPVARYKAVPHVHDDE